GLLAWELAHQLESLGRKVELVVLMDTLSFNARLPVRMLVRLMRLIAAATRGKISKKFKLDAMRAIWNRMKRHVYNGPYLCTMSNYLPPKLRCDDVVAVLCEESRGIKDFSPMPWRRLAPSVHRRYVAGTHLGAITTHAAELALLMDSLLSTGVLAIRSAGTED